MRSMANLGDGLGEWPLWRQLESGDLEGLGENAYSPRSRDLSARTLRADRVVSSVCPYCAVGCGQLVYVKDEKIIDIEGDPRSPDFARLSVSQRRGNVSTGHRIAPRATRPLPPAARHRWETIPLEQAMDMVAERVKKTRDDTWEDHEQDGEPLHRTMAIAHLGGATLDNEENYLIKKLFTALGIVQIENQARI